MSDPIQWDDPEPTLPDPMRSKPKREPGELFATIVTGVLLGGFFGVIGVLIVWLIVWLINVLPWS